MPPAPPVLGEVDLYLFAEGTHPRLYDTLGAHRATVDGKDGTWFAVWAPTAESVNVVGDFNGWNGEATRLVPHGASGVWEGFAPGASPGACYKFRIASRLNGYRVDKADPFARRAEISPRTASVIDATEYAWKDEAWMRDRAARSGRGAPMSVYEVHLGSWMRVPEEGNRFMRYSELAPKLVEYVERLGFTHVELLPVMEHPFYGSWGYETTGYFAPTSRYGDPAELMALVDALHQAGIGVILDWVPGHFPTDEHGLVFFDGSHLYEHADPRQGFHPEWQTAIFNYDRGEVRSFLLSSAMYWVDRFHADGLRVDGVASMLYLDYGRRGGEWVPNIHGGHENLGAVQFLQQLNDAVHRERPGVVTIAEESTAWPRVTGRTEDGGLGFDFKWDLGWMHDTLRYLGRDPIHRKHHQGDLTMRGLYAFSEAYVLPLSHDEVVHGKGSLYGKMAGDDWQKRANLRLLFAYMFSQPGKKLLFMGDEFGQEREWNHDASLDWHLLADERHRQLQLLVGELNRLYKTEPCLHDLDCDPAGFRWIEPNDTERSVLAYERVARDGARLIVVLNFTPVPLQNYRVGAARGGSWDEILNTDGKELGGSGHGNLGSVEAAPVPAHGRAMSVSLVVPPLGAVFLRKRGAPPAAR